MSDLVAATLAATLTGALAATGPAVFRRLPEPNPDDAPADKVPYADLAARPRLAAKLAAVGVPVGALVGQQLGWTPVLGAWIVLGYVDAQTRLLPTRIIAPTYGVLVVALAAAALAESDPLEQLIGSALGWLAFGGFYFVMWLIAPRWLGYGDVRLSGLLGLALGYLGWGEVFLGMYAGFLLGGVLGGLLSVLKVFDRKRYPFGPFMLLGALVGLVAGAPFADWYTSS